jgi:predicted nucleotidyltransferase
MQNPARHDGDLDERRSVAIAAAKEVLRRLEELGVQAKVFGSLAGGRFHHHSDIDFLVTQCPRHLKYRIEGLIEDSLPGFGFDVVYLDEIPVHRLHRFLETVADAGDLR